MDPPESLRRSTENGRNIEAEAIDTDLTGARIGESLTQRIRQTRYAPRDPQIVDRVAIDLIQ
jgi:hypothetical protein